MTDAYTVLLHALTPVHSGTGQTAAIIDLPVAREKATGYPYIPSSGLKGVLRDVATAQIPDKQEVTRLFGDQDFAGTLAFTDQRLICLPVRSYFGTFAYVTCQLALARLRRDCVALGASTPFATHPPAAAPRGGALTALTPAGSLLNPNGKIYLEDLDLASEERSEAAEIAGSLANIVFDDPAGKEGFIKRFVIVADDVFSYLSETATEIAARVRLEDDTKTVTQGGLWYEEAVPAEAIFAGIVVSDTRRGARAESLREITGRPVQIGGNASTGRGICRVMVAGL